MLAIEGKHDNAHPYFEKNKLTRNTFSLIAENHFSNTVTASLKTSLSLFNRDQTTNTYFFSATQNNFYTEASLSAHAAKHFIVSGINITGDVFTPSDATPVPVGKFSNTTQGAFVQDTWAMFETTKLEAGIRIDHHNDYGNFVLPRIAIFHHFSDAWGTRLGFGMGYKTPNPLTPQIRDYDINQIQPIGINVGAEKSTGANIELNYKKEFGEGKSFFINHAFFLTNINDPIIATEDITGKLTFANQQKPITTQGFDTYIQLELHHLELYPGLYVYQCRKKVFVTRSIHVVNSPPQGCFCNFLRDRTPMALWIGRIVYR
jgi:iron complex outermembrane receptor protein/outer membrane receptor for ferrienterochelin and colicins